jgi:hypothetical protein
VALVDIAIKRHDEAIDRLRQRFSSVSPLVSASGTSRKPTTKWPSSSSSMIAG